MKKLLLLLVAVALVAAASAYLTHNLLPPEATCYAPQKSGYAALNESLHLTPEQKSAVLDIERVFEAREAVLRADLDKANRDLAQTIAAENAYTPKVAAAVEHVHMCMGELQKASIAHLFDLSAQLDAVQRETLMRHVALALGGCGK